MNKIYAFTAAAKAASLIVAFVLFAPIAFATLLQAAQIVA
jgi:hypothetical protein